MLCAEKFSVNDNPNNSIHVDLHNSMHSAGYPLAMYVIHHATGHQINSRSPRRAAHGETVHVSPGEAIELLCTVEGERDSKAYSKLEWLDGKIPIKTTGGHFDTNRTTTNARKVATKGVCRASLSINNFTIYDYGDYRCHCINNYTNETFPLDKQLKNPRSPSQIGPTCSEEYLIRLLPKGT